MKIRMELAPPDFQAIDRHLAMANQSGITVAM
jgi:hypothetical protein